MVLLPAQSHTPGLPGSQVVASSISSYALLNTSLTNSVLFLCALLQHPETVSPSLFFLLFYFLRHQQYRVLYKEVAQLEYLYHVGSSVNWNDHPGKLFDNIY